MLQIKRKKETNHEVKNREEVDEDASTLKKSLLLYFAPTHTWHTLKAAR